jgi:hypothetical protein
MRRNMLQFARLGKAADQGAAAARQDAFILLNPFRTELKR